MEIADPFSGEFDFAALQVDEHARIEVLRGPQSALYGSDAIGGVIHYITQSGRDAPGASLRVEGGSFGSRELAARFAGVAGALDYALTAGDQTSDGTPTSRTGSRDIGAANQFFASRLGWQANDALRLRAVVRASRSRADFNDQDFDFLSPTYGAVIDSDDRSSTRSIAALLAAQHASGDGRLLQELSVQGIDSGRDAFDATGRQTGDDASRVKASYVASLAWNGTRAAQRLVFALDQERERFRNSSPLATPAQAAARAIDNTGVVGEYDGRIGERTGVGLALRHDRNQRFDDATTFRGQVSHRLAGATRLHFAVGTGIKNPTPIELFGYDPESFIGNPALKPEKSRGWEVGVNQLLLEGRLRLGFVWARSRLQDEVYTRFSPTFVATPDNRATFSHQRSAEFEGQLRLGQAWRLDAAYTWLKAREDGIEEVRRPPRSGSLSAHWQAPGGRLALDAGLRFNGATRDLNFTHFGPPLVTLGSYTLLQLGAQYRLSSRLLSDLHVYGRVENLLDESYEDVYTYRSPGRAGVVGLRVAF
jgi:vitamin B12 transporter